MRQGKSIEEGRRLLMLYSKLISYDYGSEGPYNRSKRQYFFDDLAANDKIKKFISPDNRKEPDFYKQGWVFLDHIEQNDVPFKGFNCPYPIKTADKKRYYFLNDKNGFIEKTKLKYRIKKQKKKSETMYRLKKDYETFKKIFIFFFEAGEVYVFIASDYFRDSTAPWAKGTKLIGQDLQIMCEYMGLGINMPKELIESNKTKAWTYIQSIPAFVYEYWTNEERFKEIMAKVNKELKDIKDNYDDSNIFDILLIGGLTNSLFNTIKLNKSKYETKSIKIELWSHVNNLFSKAYIKGLQHKKYKKEQELHKRAKNL